MAINKLFQVYDSKAQAYLGIIETTTTGLALRSFIEAANREDHNFNRYAADYTLFETGDRDDSTGIITNLEAKINLGTALEHIEPVATALTDLSRTERA